MTRGGKFAVAMTVVSIALLIFIVGERIDFGGMEIQRGDYENIDKDIKEYPQLAGLVRELLADGKITVTEQGRYQQALEKAKHDAVINSIERAVSRR